MLTHDERVAHVAQHFGVSEDFVRAAVAPVASGADSHPYRCSCAECLEWWRAMGPDPETGGFGPFALEEILGTWAKMPAPDEVPTSAHYNWWTSQQEADVALQSFTFRPRNGQPEQLWNVSLAKWIIKTSAPREVFLMSLAGLETWIDPNAGNIEIDPKPRAVDLNFPLIAVVTPDEGTDLIIDGWHRVAYAFEDGQPDLPAVFLTREELARCVMFKPQVGRCPTCNAAPGEPCHEVISGKPFSAKRIAKHGPYHADRVRIASKS